MESALDHGSRLWGFESSSAYQRRIQQFFLKENYVNGSQLVSKTNFAGSIPALKILFYRLETNARVME